MSEIKTNQISASTGTELTLNARVRMIGDGASTPTNATHLCRKDYVDSHSRIGATVSFSMAFGSAYTAASDTFGFIHTASQNTITFPTGSWTGWVSTNASGTTTTTAFSSAAGSQAITAWTSSPAVFCLTRVS